MPEPQLCGLRSQTARWWPQMPAVLLQAERAAAHRHTAPVPRPCTDRRLLRKGLQVCRLPRRTAHIEAGVARTPPSCTMKQPCLDCGTPSDRSRCNICAGMHNAKTSRARPASKGRPYNSAAYRHAAAFVRANAQTCHICGHGPRRDDPWQADHLIPVVGGGGTGPLAPAHRSCNISRANKLRAGLPDIAGDHLRRRTRGVHPPTNPPTTPAPWQPTTDQPRKPN